jgi:hypothetical protein
MFKHGVSCAWPHPTATCSVFNRFKRFFRRAASQTSETLTSTVHNRHLTAGLNHMASQSLKTKYGCLRFAPLFGKTNSSIFGWFTTFKLMR